MHDTLAWLSCVFRRALVHCVFMCYRSLCFHVLSFIVFSCVIVHCVFMCYVFRVIFWLGIAPRHPTEGYQPSVTIAAGGYSDRWL